jgi:hypothetical protein
VAADNVLGGAGRTAVGHMLDVDMRDEFEQFHGEVMKPANTRRCAVQLALVGFGVSDEFFQISRWHRRIDT